MPFNLDPHQNMVSRKARNLFVLLTILSSVLVSVSRSNTTLYNKSCLSNVISATIIPSGAFSNKTLERHQNIIAFVYYAKTCLAMMRLQNMYNKYKILYIPFVFSYKLFSVKMLIFKIFQVKRNSSRTSLKTLT